MAKQELCVVTAREEYGSGLFALTLHAPGLAALAQPGQFVHITCGEGSFLRRPISICDVQGEELKIVFQVKGEGTAWLSRRTPKHQLDVLGPLGHGFDLAALGERPVMIGGGIGVPPMLYVMKAAKAAARSRPRFSASAPKPRSFWNLILRRPASPISAPTTAPTACRALSRTNYACIWMPSPGICACGPKPMLKALAALAEEAGIPCQVSMEERMGCGIGACLVCACELKLRDGQEGVRYGHVCKDGPVFDAKEVVW